MSFETATENASRLPITGSRIACVDDVVPATDVWEAERPAPVPPHSIPLEPTMLGLVESILKAPERLNLAIQDVELSRVLMPRLLTLSTIGFVFFGVAMSLVFSSSGTWPELQPLKTALKTSVWDGMVLPKPVSGSSQLAPWLNGQALRLILAYAVGLIAATGICLPSLYFYGLLSGFRLTMLDVVNHALKAKATTAVALIGILPIYAAVALGIILFDAPTVVRSMVFHLGLCLPFIAGLAGTVSLYRGLGSLACTMTRERRRNRECFLRRLVLSWCCVYTAVSPVMIHELWVTLGG